MNELSEFERGTPGFRRGDVQGVVGFANSRQATGLYSVIRRANQVCAMMRFESLDPGLRLRAWKWLCSWSVSCWNSKHGDGMW